jgi:hypothetical protein
MTLPVFRVHPPAIFTFNVEGVSTHNVHNVLDFLSRFQKGSKKFKKHLYKTLDTNQPISSQYR